MPRPALHASLALRRNAPCALRPEHLPGVSRPEIREQLHFPPTAGLRVLLATSINPCPNTKDHVLHPTPKIYQD
jgi:hypothetical protein